MLNPFPIQFLALLAYTLLRFFVGGILVYLGITHLKKRHDLKYALSLKIFPFGLFSAWYIGIIEIVIGTMFFLGFYTQIAALILMPLALKMIIYNKKIASPYIPNRIFWVLLLGCAFSLFITGAGAFAFDLPI